MSKIILAFFLTFGMAATASAQYEIPSAPQAETGNESVETIDWTFN